MRSRIFCLLIALVFLPLTAFAQNSWHLTNISNQKLEFETYAYSRGTWKKQVIFPNQRTSYTVSDGSQSGKFRISTEHRGYVEYSVEVGRDYTVGWDRNKGVWDLKFARSSYQKRQSQDNYGESESESERLGYHLYNASNQRLPFETFDHARGTWKQQTAYPNENKKFVFRDGYDVGKIRISTQGRGYVVYDVRAGWKYKLLFDNYKGVWDVQTVSRRN